MFSVCCQNEWHSILSQLFPHSLGCVASRHDTTQSLYFFKSHFVRYPQLSGNISLASFKPRVKLNGIHNFFSKTASQFSWMKTSFCLKGIEKIVSHLVMSGDIVCFSWLQGKKQPSVEQVEARDTVLLQGTGCPSHTRKPPALKWQCCKVTGLCASMAKGSETRAAFLVVIQPLLGTTQGQLPKARLAKGLKLSVQHITLAYWLATEGKWDHKNQSVL